MEAQRMIRIIAAVLLLVIGAPALAEEYLWEVTSLKNKVYLFGTIHAGKKEWFPLPLAVERAFEDSKVLVVEADIADPNKIMKSATAMMYPPEDSLQKHVAMVDYTRFQKLLPRYKVPEAAVVQMKPFMAVSFLVLSEWLRLGYSPDFGVDAYFLAKARAELKPIVEIEGVDSQIALMESLTEDENRVIFEGTLTALENGLTKEQVEEMVDAWQAGDPNALLKTARKYNESVKGAAAFEEKFVWSRHEPMMKKIEGYLAETRDRHFIAVGALHLAGPRGLVELLRKKGYVVKQAGVVEAGATIK
jgi:uncharacterized protein YbaP (TraB family)